ncbi:hypothetical protein RCL1_005921 [Eukaryota sp. TZLM3-RCL]
MLKPPTEYSLRFCEELEPAEVVVASLKDTDNLILDHLFSKLRSGISTECPFVAVDSEWLCFDPKRRLDVIQISSFSLTLVLQVHNQRKLPQSLVTLFVDSSVLKVFKDPTEDLIRIKEVFGVQMSPVYDVTNMAKLLSDFSCDITGKDDFQRAFMSLGLTPLLSKNTKISRSKWNVSVLNLKQVVYAAFDTIFILSVFSTMTRCHVTLLHLGQEFDSWDIHQVTFSKTWQALAQISVELQSIINALYAVNRSTSTVISPSSTPTLTDCDLICVCKSCNEKVILNDSNYVLSHKCFNKKTRLYMCSKCRSFENYNVITYLMHLLCNCHSHSNEDALLSTLNEFEQSQPELRMMNFNALFLLFKNLSPENEDKITAVVKTKLSPTTVADVENLLNGLSLQDRTLLNNLVYHFLPHLFNGMSINSNDLNISNSITTCPEHFDCSFLLFCFYRIIMPLQQLKSKDRSFVIIQLRSILHEGFEDGFSDHNFVSFVSQNRSARTKTQEATPDSLLQNPSIQQPCEMIEKTDTSIEEAELACESPQDIDTCILDETNTECLSSSLELLCVSETQLETYDYSVLVPQTSNSKKSSKKKPKKSKQSTGKTPNTNSNDCQASTCTSHSSSSLLKDPKLPALFLGCVDGVLRIWERETPVDDKDTVSQLLNCDPASLSLTEIRSLLDNISEGAKHLLYCLVHHFLPMLFNSIPLRPIDHQITQSNSFLGYKPTEQDHRCSIFLLLFHNSMKAFSTKCNSVRKVLFASFRDILCQVYDNDEVDWEAISTTIMQLNENKTATPDESNGSNLHIEDHHTNIQPVATNSDKSALSLTDNVEDTLCTLLKSRYCSVTASFKSQKIHSPPLFLGCIDGLITVFQREVCEEDKEIVQTLLQTDPSKLSSSDIDSCLTHLSEQSRIFLLGLIKLLLPKIFNAVPLVAADLSITSKTKTLQTSHSDQYHRCIVFVLLFHNFMKQFLVSDVNVRNSMFWEFRRICCYVLDTENPDWQFVSNEVKTLFKDISSLVNGGFSEIEVSPCDVSLYCPLLNQFEDCSISVHFSPLVKDYRSLTKDDETLVLETDSRFDNVLSAGVHLDYGTYYLYFFKNDEFFINPVYPLQLVDDLSLNYINVQDVTQVTHFDDLADLSVQERMLSYLEYVFGNDYFYLNSHIHSKCKKLFLPFEELIALDLLKTAAEQLNFDLNKESLIELAKQSSQLIISEKFGVKRKDMSIPSLETIQCRKLSVFPLKSTDEVLDLVREITYNDCEVSSIISHLKGGCICADLVFSSSEHVVSLLSQELLVFDDRSLIVRTFPVSATKLMNQKSTVQHPSSDKQKGKGKKLVKPGAKKPKKLKIKTPEERDSFRKASGLPILSAYWNVRERLHTESVIVCIAETGSGKTTQLPQYAAEYCKHYFPTSDLKVVCTQPRAIAALSLAERIAFEYDGPNILPGVNVGYEVSGKKVSGKEILLMTDGCLIRKAANDLLLSDIRVLIIDEAHERSLDTDIVLGIAKLVCQQRPDFRVIIASATIDPAAFLNYFYKNQYQQPSPLKVPGRLFKVTLDEQATDRDTLIMDLPEIVLEAMLNPHYYEDNNPTGHVLVFVSGVREIEQSISKLQSLCHEQGLENIVVKPLHGKLLGDQQKEVLEFDEKQNTSGDLRMVCFCTNVAETSLTVHGVKLVVDTGLAKEARYCPVRRMTVLREVYISKSSADQRKGRAGRLSQGHCLRLYSYEKDLERDSIEPEILRSSLDFVSLKLVSLNQDPVTFDLIDRPNTDHITQSVRLLTEFGCIQNNKVTDLGKFFFDQQLDVRLSYFVYACAVSGFLKLGANVASILAAPGSMYFHFFDNPEDKQKIQEQRSEFASEFTSDIELLLEVLLKYEQHYNKNTKFASKYARQENLNNKICAEICKQTFQLERSFSKFLSKQKVTQNESSYNLFRPVLSQALVKSFPEQLVQFVSSYFSTVPDLYLLGAQLKGRINKDSVFIQKHSSTKFAIALSILDSEFATFVDRIHPIEENELPSSVQQYIDDHSLKTSKVTLYTNVGLLYFNQFSRYFRAFNDKESRDSLFKMVDVAYQGNSIIASAPEVLHQEVVSMCRSFIDNMRYKELQKTHSRSLDGGFSVTFSEGFRLEQITSCGPSIVVKRPANERKSEFIEFCEVTVGKQLLNKITNYNLNPLSYSLVGATREDVAAECGDYQRGFITLPAISDDLYTAFMEKFAAAGVTDDVREAVPNEYLHAKPEFVWSSSLQLVEAKEKVPGASIKVMQEPSGTLLLRDLPPESNVSNIKAVFNDKTVKVKASTNQHGVFYTVTTTPSNLTAVKQKLNESPLFTQSWTKSFYNRSGVSCTKSVNGCIFNEFVQSLKLVVSFSSHDACFGTFERLKAEGHDVYFLVSRQFDLEVCCQSSIRSALEAFSSVTLTPFKDNKGLSMIVKDAKSYFKATSLFVSMTEPLKLTFTDPLQICMVEEIKKRNVFKEWQRECNVSVSVGKTEKFGSIQLTIHGEGFNRGKFMSLFTDYSTEFAQRFSITSVLPQQLPYFTPKRKGAKSLFDKYVATNNDLGSCYYIPYNKASRYSIENLEQFVSQFLASQKVSQYLSHEICVYCHGECRSGTAFTHCGHSYCTSCFKDTILRTFSSGQLESEILTCPCCHVAVAVKDVRLAFNQGNDFLDLLKKIVSSVIISFPRLYPTVTSCSNFDCRSIMTRVKGYCFCKECGRGQCHQCGAVNDVCHVGKTCEQYEHLKETSSNHLETLFIKAEQFVQDLWNISPTLTHQMRNPNLLEGCPAIQRFSKVVLKHGIACLEQVKFAWHGTKYNAVSSIAYDGF